jgi:pyruvate ferredoxin oxidoreductase beta subunit
VERYLERQGRFSHLFEPERNEVLLARIQASVDAYWEGIE